MPMLNCLVVWPRAGRPGIELPHFRVPVSVMPKVLLERAALASRHHGWHA